MERCVSNEMVNGVNYVNGLPVVHGRSYHSTLSVGDAFRWWLTDDSKQIRKIRIIRLTNR